MRATKKNTRQSCGTIFVAVKEMYDMLQWRHRSVLVYHLIANATACSLAVRSDNKKTSNADPRWEEFINDQWDPLTNGL